MRERPGEIRDLKELVEIRRAASPVRVVAHVLYMGAELLPTARASIEMRIEPTSEACTSAPTAGPIRAPIALRFRHGLSG